jgi:hypothetical protein
MGSQISRAPSEAIWSASEKPSHPIRDSGLPDKVFGEKTLRAAFSRLAQNSGSRGMDGKTVEALGDRLDEESVPRRRESEGRARLVSSMQSRSRGYSWTIFESPRPAEELLGIGSCVLYFGSERTSTAGSPIRAR